MKTLLLCTLCATAQLATGSSIVNFNTTGLSGLSGPPTVVFTLFNGDGTPNNTVSLSGITLGGGTAIGAPLLTIGASGTLLGGVTLVDSIFQVEFSQAWTIGSSFRFVLDFTSTFPGSSPDSFSLVFIDPSTGLPIPTLDPFGTDTFLSVDLRPGAAIQTYRSDLSRTSINLNAPVVTPVVTLEPSTLLIVGLGLSVLHCRKRLINSVAH